MSFIKLFMLALAVVVPLLAIMMPGAFYVPSTPAFPPSPSTRSHSASSSTASPSSPPSSTPPAASTQAETHPQTDKIMFGTDISGMSNTDIKEELRNLYAVTDFGDCIEPGDLQKKLQTTRDTQPITHGLRYGALLQIGNKVNPSGIVTLSHGLGDSAYGWEDVGHELANRLPYLLFLLPTAPQRAVTVNGGMAMPAWYDIKGMISQGLRSGKQDAAGVLQSVDYVRSLAHTHAVKYNVPLQRVVYAGFSQGAAISLATGLTAHVAPAGVVCMSGYLAGMAEVMARLANKNSPIAMFHGRQDPVVPLGAAKETQQVLMEEGGVQSVEFKEYNMQHSATPQEINDVESFIRRVLPEKSSV